MTTGGLAGVCDKMSVVTTFDQDVGGNYGRE